MVGQYRVTTGPTDPRILPRRTLVRTRSKGEPPRRCTPRSELPARPPRRPSRDQDVPPRRV